MYLKSEFLHTVIVQGWILWYGSKGEGTSVFLLLAVQQWALLQLFYSKCKRWQIKPTGKHCANLKRLRSAILRRE